MDAALSAAYGVWIERGGWTGHEFHELGASLTDKQIADKLAELEPVEHRCHVSRTHLVFLRALQGSRT